MIHELKNPPPCAQSARSGHYKYVGVGKLIEAGDYEYDYKRGLADDTESWKPVKKKYVGVAVPPNCAGSFLRAQADFEGVCLMDIKYALIGTCDICGNVTAADMDWTPEYEAEMQMVGRTVSRVTRAEAEKAWSMVKKCDHKALIQELRSKVEKK